MFTVENLVAFLERVRVALLFLDNSDTNLKRNAISFCLHNHDPDIENKTAEESLFFNKTSHENEAQSIPFLLHLNSKFFDCFSIELTIFAIFTMRD